MLKKFVKKIGKGIKKIGKAIGKPFKKLMKTKLGKVIGTIGMMMIGGWMMQGARAFTTSLFNAQGLGTAFGEGISAMGQAAQASYKTITEGITGMFGETATSQKASAEALAANTEAGAAGSVDVAEQAMETTRTRLREAATELPSGKVVGDDALAGQIKSTVDIPTTPTTAERLDFAVQSAAETDPAQYLAKDSRKGIFGLRNERTITRNLNPQIDPQTGKRIVPEGFTEVSSFSDTAGAPKSLLDKAYDMPFEEIKDRTYGYQPFKDTNLPGVIREGTLGQGYALSQALATPEEQYVQGYSDMSGAYSALDANTARLQSAIPTIEQLQDGRTSIPSPSLVGIGDYLNQSRKAGFVWDTSLLAVKPANFGQ
jgi:hypothetical protein